MWFQTLDRMSFWALFLVVVLLPIFFLPFSNIAVDVSKNLLLIIGLAVTIIFWVLARISEKKVILPKSFLLFALFLLTLFYFVSSYFSSSPKMSFFGTMLDSGSFWFVLTIFLLSLFSAIILGNQRNASAIVIGILLSSFLVFIFQIARLIFPEVLAFGIFENKIDNLIGSWRSFGIFSGFSAVIGLFVFEFFTLSRGLKFALGLLLALSFAAMSIASFPLIWPVVGIFAVIVFIYKISFATGQNLGARASFPTASLVVILISLMFLVSSGKIASVAEQKLGIVYSEASPSFESTFHIARESFKLYPLLGSGPNTFADSWAMNKPAMVNNSLFWNIPFNSGFGLFPTFFATIGYLGIFFWGIFFLFFLIKLSRSVIPRAEESPNILASIFFVAALYVFIMSFFYLPGGVLFYFAFVFVGIAIGLGVNGQARREIVLDFSQNRGKNFFAALVLMFFLAGSAVLAFKYAERFSSLYFFNKSLRDVTLEVAEENTRKAVTIYQNDLYLRRYAQLYAVKLSALAQDADITEEEKLAMQSALDQALSGAFSAISFNSNNYLNFQTLGMVYGTAAAFGADGSYEKSKEAFIRASALNPLNPSPKLGIARVAFVSKRTSEAKIFTNEALAIKPDYTEALVLLSQIAKNQGNNTEAISFAEKALATVPNNNEIRTYLDSLKDGQSSE